MFDSATSYDRFMGRYSRPLARDFAAYAGLRPGQRALDVGCGPGALTGVLVETLGSSAVAAVDPSPAFVEAARDRFPSVDVRLATAERLPFSHGTFDVSLAQLVVHFMSDPIAGLSEMRRVTRPGGSLAACVWDYTRDSTPLTVFWKAARELDSSIETESRLPGSTPGDLRRLFEAAGIVDVEETTLSIEVEHPDFDDWWEPFTLGVGPAGKYVASLGSDAEAELRELCRLALPSGAFTLEARALTARGQA
jgi:SAM-dependent methyltransferase